jgi:predicted metal-dependent hydrolase
MYYVYIIQCKDLSFYTGITTDLARRIKEHNVSAKGAKYTRSRGPVRLVYVAEFPDRSTASIEEARIKNLSRTEKITLIKTGRKEYLAGKRLKEKKSRELYLDQKEDARAVILADLARMNALYGFTYNSVAIRNQKTRWGSCSKKKNLNFSYRLLTLSPVEREYVVVHELCHLEQMNHSKAFWDLVAQGCPDYKNIRKQLRSRSMSL